MLSPPAGRADAPLSPDAARSLDRPSNDRPATLRHAAGPETLAYTYRRHAGGSQGAKLYQTQYAVRTPRPAWPYLSDAQVAVASLPDFRPWSSARSTHGGSAGASKR